MSGERDLDKAEGDQGQAAAGIDPVAFDTSVAHIARVYDYWLGGKDNFAADREAAEQVIAANPGVRAGVLAQPRVPRPCRALPGRRGRRPPVPRHRHRHPDRGQHPRGSPGGGTRSPGSSTSTTTRSCSLHARALLASHPAGAADYIDADLRDTGTILTAAARTLDFSQPIAIMLLG